MSKRRVKEVGVDDEFDEFDDEYDDEEYDADAERQLKEGTAKVKAVVGDEFAEAEIRDALWHYYYDVEKSVNYLLSNRTTKPQKKSKASSKSQKGTCNSPWYPHVLASGWPRYSPFRLRSCYNDLVDANAGASATGLGLEADTSAVERAWTRRDVYSRAKPAEDFFNDAPWLDVPSERMADIQTESLWPQSRLLGGASNAPKQSKLGALAAARKRKENDRPSESSSATNASVALLDKLTLKSKDAEVTEPSTDRTAPSSQSAPVGGDSTEASKRPRRYLPRKKIEDKEPSPTEAKPEPLERIPTIPQEQQLEMPVLPTASSFAQTLFGTSRATPTTGSDLPLDHYDPFPEKHAENPFAGPSPDDIVSKAQSTSKGLNKNAKGSAKESSKAKDASGLSTELERTKIDDTPRVKSKNIDVVAAYEKAEKKNTANFVVIGHVDAGKSTLMGRLLHELSIVDKRTLDKYQKDASNMGKASFALAWIMDASADERSRGVTIDIAMSKFETDSTVFTILDAPGHKDFVPNMIAGASRADFAVLVVDASTNNFESGLKGQTKEHALLVRSLGVQRLIVAVNKLDAVNWSQERFDEISQQTSSFLGAAGFQTSNVAFVPCSGLQGENVTKKSQIPELSSWFRGTSLLEQLEAAASPRTFPVRGPLRMPVADILVGGVVYPLSLLGRLSSGSCQVGDQIIAVPSNTTGSIRALEVDGENAEYAVAGQNATLHVSDMDGSTLRAGDIVCAPQNPIPARSKFTLKALAFAHLTPMFVSVIAGRADVAGRIDALTALLDKNTGVPGKKKPRIVKPGEVARLSVTIEGDNGLPVEEGARVVLRSSGETVATGLVE